MLRILLQTYQDHHGITLRDLERLTGVSFVTLHRFIKGKPIEGDSMVKIWTWLLSPKKGGKP
jgi:hypothetical protein